MDIKKRLNAAAKQLTPEIEASNTGIQIREHTARIEELLVYAADKEKREAQRKETGLSYQAREEKRRAALSEADHVVAARVQAEDEAVNLEDQQQAAAQPDVAEEPETATA